MRIFTKNYQDLTKLSENSHLEKKTQLFQKMKTFPQIFLVCRQCPGILTGTSKNCDCSIYI